MKKTKAFLALMVMCTLIFELCVPVAGAFAMDGANMHADIVHNFDLQSVVRTQVLRRLILMTKRATTRQAIIPSSDHLIRCNTT